MLGFCSEKSYLEKGKEIAEMNWKFPTFRKWTFIPCVK